MEQIRNSTRVFGITLFDFILTYVSGYIFYVFILPKTGIKINAYAFYGALLPLSVIVHLLFGIKTSYTTGLKERNVFYISLLVISCIITVINFRK